LNVKPCIVIEQTVVGRGVSNFIISCESCFLNTDLPTVLFSLALSRICETFQELDAGLKLSSILIAAPYCLKKSECVRPVRQEHLSGVVDGIKLQINNGVTIDIPHQPVVKPNCVVCVFAVRA
jgi:hypothetical protein